MIGLRRQGWWSSVCLAAVLAGTAAAEEVAVNGQALPPQPVEQTSAVAEPQAVLNAAGNDAQAAWTTGGVAPISYEWTPVPGTAAQTYAPAAPASNRLFGLIAPSDTCFADFVSPITNPLFFEDPRTLSESPDDLRESLDPGQQPGLQRRQRAVPRGAGPRGPHRAAVIHRDQRRLHLARQQQRSGHPG